MTSSRESQTKSSFLSSTRHVALALGTGASVKGRLFAQTAVSIESSTVTAP